ncbi:glycosyltransferase [Iamia majanohamensis]|uniref:Glycosyltransferase n=1 Tax=Iamia majanohamensis TaxID=467976 RepID=A0AAE9Y7R1_9ACTN|nr:glycosyltransferase [Iamia majanohamensis]WCO65864.1 glycosyltransferase [Iamia majanohamensis]
MNDDRVSVVLATYDGDRYLGEQLASLMAQRRLPDEVIVIDDASTDGTQDRLEEFAKRAPFPVDLELRSEHLGTWTTFEEGLRRATGDIVLICDQDDRWREDKLAVLTARMAAQPDAMMAFADARLIDAEGGIIGRSRWRVAGFSPRHSRAVDLDPFGPLFSRQAVSGCAMAVRAELLSAVLPFPVDVHPALGPMMYDRWTSLTAAAVGPVITVPERLVDYRIHPGQQVGIPALGVRRLAPRTALHAAQLLHRRVETLRRMEYHLAHLEEIAARLRAAGLATPASDARLASAARHLRFRTSLDRHRLSRVRSVAEEMRREDGYRRFSLGVVSALADLAR